MSHPVRVRPAVTNAALPIRVSSTGESVWDSTFRHGLEIGWPKLNRFHDPAPTPDRRGARGAPSRRCEARSPFGIWTTRFSFAKPRAPYHQEAVAVGRFHREGLTGALFRARRIGSGWPAGARLLAGLAKRQSLSRTMVKNGHIARGVVSDIPHAGGTRPTRELRSHTRTRLAGLLKELS